MAHVIRLRGPWHYEPLAAAGEGEHRLPPPGSARMPATWSEFLGDFRGCVALRRRFGCPTGLAPRDRVELVIEAVHACGSAELNGQPLAERLDHRGGRFDVTDRLRERNELAIIIQWPGDEADKVAPAGGSLGEVRLEIHAAR